MAEPLGVSQARLPSHKELRRPTVLFCDLVGSTRLGARLDMEDYCALIDGYQDLCERQITAAGGWVTRAITSSARTRP